MTTMTTRGIPYSTHRDRRVRSVERELGRHSSDPLPANAAVIAAGFVLMLLALADLIMVLAVML
jgi:hypothetical protein